MLLQKLLIISFLLDKKEHLLPEPKTDLISLYCGVAVSVVAIIIMVAVVTVVWNGKRKRKKHESKYDLTF